MEPAKHDTRYQTKICEKEAEKGTKRLEKEIEKDVRMEEREITSVEDVEELLTPTEPTKTTKEPNRTTIETKMDRLMKMFQQVEEREKEIIDKGFRRIEETMERSLKKWSEPLDGTSGSIKVTLNENKEPLDQKVEAVSYTHLLSIFSIFHLLIIDILKLLPMVLL